MKMRKGFFILSLALMAILVLGCSGRSGDKEDQGSQESESKGKRVEESAPSYGDGIIFGSIGDISGLIPQVTSDSASHEIASFIYNSLVRYDKDLKLEGELAKSWEVKDGGLKIIFHLRKGVRWHDGKPFTSKDVLFTYELMIDPHTPTAYAEDFLQVKKAYAPDLYTFIVEYRKPFAPALSSWGISILPHHILQGSKDILKSVQNKHPVGTGSYRFVEWKPGEKIVLEGNKDYFEGRPYIKRIIYRIIPDQATMFLELKAGGVDFMGLTPLQYTRQTESEGFKKLYKKYHYFSFGYTYLGYNLENPLFKDVRVRQGLSYAIRREDIIKGVLFGLGVTATGPYKPGTWAYNPNVKRYKYDPAKAKSLLEDAGWADTDGDGILDKNGKKFSFILMTNQGNESRAKAAVMIQRFFKQVGVEVKIRVIEWAAFINEFIDKRKFDAVLLGWSIGQDPDQYDIWHSSKTGPKELNFIGYHNKEVDRLLDLGRRTFEREKRKDYYWKIQEILAEEQPYNFLFVPESLPTVSSRFRRIAPAPSGIMYNFIKWYVPSGEVRYSRF